MGKKQSGRTKFVAHNRVVDVDGVITQETTHSVYSPESEPEYVKMYLNDLLSLLGVGDKIHDVLFLLLRKMNYDNQIVLNSNIRADLSKDLNIKIDTLRKYIDKFSELNILVKKKVNFYEVNPFYFGRGKWPDIKKIRMNIEYNKTGRNISSKLT